MSRNFQSSQNSNRPEGQRLDVRGLVGPRFGRFRLGVPEGSNDAVRIREVLEKYDLNRGLALLREARRALRPGGTIRIVTPDFDSAMSQLACSGSGDTEPSSQLPAAEDKLISRRAAAWNSFFRSHRRKFIYDLPTLQEMLKLAGFTQITRSEPAADEWKTDQYESCGPAALLVVDAKRAEAPALPSTVRVSERSWRRTLSRDDDIRRSVHRARQIARRCAFALSNRSMVRRHLRQDLSKLQIGAGINVLPGWLNTDLFARRNVAYLDLMKPFPFADAAFKYVFSECQLYTLAPAAAMSMLREVRRVLKPNGVFRVSTPHLGVMRDLYSSDEPVFRRYVNWACETFCFDAPVKNKSVVINNFARDWGGEFMYDCESLDRMLRAAGFDSVARCNVGESRYEPLNNLESHGRIIGEEFNRLEAIVFEAAAGSDPSPVTAGGEPQK